MTKYGIGQPVSRFEDPRLLRGRGRYQDDLTLPGQAYAVFLRSPHAHARIRAVDTAAAVAMPGVLAVFSGADVAADGLGTMAMRLQRKRPDGLPMFARPHPGLARDRVRYVGDPVAMVVAESVAQAKDAAELRRRRLRAVAVGHRHRRRGEAGGAASLGRVPGQRLEPVRSRRQGGRRRRLRPRPAHVSNAAM